MSDNYDSFKDFGSGDLLNMKAREAQISSAKQLADQNNRLQKIQETVRAREEAHKKEIITREKEEEARYRVSLQAEALRHKENRRLSWIAIGIALASFLLAIFK